jgi:tRNA A-37 threonylcarbamoyl transferase component Bud32
VEAWEEPRQSRGPGRTLVGHSGVSITLLRTLGGSVVRKMARHAGQNPRLKAQGDKLREANNRGLPCPRVLADGIREGLFYFDMEYIPGETLANAVTGGRQLDWGRVIAQIMQVVASFRDSQTGVLDASVLRAKLQNIALACRSNLTDRNLIAEIDRVAHKLRGLDWGDIRVSACHGDLTLENILVRLDESLVFIDFDVPEQQSWMLDVGKLYQDLLGHWCIRYLAPARATDPVDVGYLNADVRLDQLAGLVSDQVKVIAPGLEKRCGQFAAFHLLRTLPYATERRMVEFVLRRIAVLTET